MRSRVDDFVACRFQVFGKLLLEHIAAVVGPYHNAHIGISSFRVLYSLLVRV